MTTSLKKGQSSVELAMLLPVVAFLIYMILMGYHAHHDSTDASIQLHAEALKDFDHGKNMAPVVINGVEIAPGSFEVLQGTSFGGLLPTMLATSGINLGMNALMNNIPGLNQDKIMPSYMRGSIGSATSQFAANGFDANKINWDQADRAGMVSGLSSGEADKLFQGDKANLDQGFNSREFYGSAAQGAAVGISASHDLAQGLWGGMGGLLGSNSFNNILKGHNEMEMGALRGALVGWIGGLASGHLDLGTVAKSAATGAFYTETAAKMLPGLHDSKDPLSTATFGAVNGAVSVLISQGKKSNGGNVLLAMAGGAFFSGNFQKSITGNSKGMAAFTKSLAGDAAFVGGMAAITGGDTAAVGRAVAASLEMQGSSYGLARARGAASHFLGKDPPGIRGYLDQANPDPDAVSYASELDDLQMGRP